MASRLTSFMSGRPAALLWSIAAVLFCLALYWQWRSFEAQQAVFLTFHARAAPNFPAGELDGLAPSSGLLVMFGVLTGFMVAFALMQWRPDPKNR